MPINGIRLLAHRGARTTSVENTLAAWARAKQEGVDGVEIDVQLSADGEPFIFHDDDGARMAGEPAVVSELSWRQLRRLRVLGKHKIPHLDEALEALESWPGVEMTIDFHQDSLRLAETVAARVRACAARDRVSVLDFFWRRSNLLRAREVYPGMRLSVMPGPPWDMVKAVKQLGAVEACFGWDGALTRSLYRGGCLFYDARGPIARVRAAGVPVGGGVADSEEDIRYILDQGADGIWTDDLVSTRRILQAITAGS